MSPRSGATALASALLVAIAAPSSARAQGLPGRDRSGESFRNVGALGLGVEVASNEIAVKRVHEGPAKQAGIAEGDAIVGLDGRAFERGDPVLAVVAAVERAEATKKGGAVVLVVRRGGKDVAVKVPFAYAGKHSPECPKKCEKCKRVVERACDWLARAQAGDGAFPTELGGKTGKVVVTSLGALAFLAAGAPADSPPVARALGFVLARCNGKEDGLLGGGGGSGANWNQTNWELAYGSIFLAEAAKRTGRGDVKAKLDEVVKVLQKNQEASGGWAHGPGGPNALGYLELEILSNWSLMGLGVAKKCGVAVDAKQIARAIAWIEGTSSGDGGVGYSERPGQKGFGEAGRTSGAIVAFAALGERRHPFFEKMAGFYRGHMKSLETGHVSPCMHLLTGALASSLLGPKDWADYMETYRLPILAARRPDGSFAPTPTQESKALHSNTDATVGPCWTTATYALILSIPNEKLPLLQGKAAPAAPEKPGRTATGGAGRGTGSGSRSGSGSGSGDDE